MSASLERFESIASLTFLCCLDFAPIELFELYPSSLSLLELSMSELSGAASAADLNFLMTPFFGLT